MRTGLPVFQQPIRDFVSAFRCLGHRVDSETIAAFGLEDTGAILPLPPASRV
jgi:hypothetical protein